LSGYLADRGCPWYSEKGEGGEVSAAWLESAGEPKSKAWLTLCVAMCGLPRESAAA